MGKKRALRQSMSPESKALTRRGVVRTLAQEWRPEESPADTTPAHAPTPDDLLAAWGVSRDEAAALARDLICPACGKGPWKALLVHAAKKHGIEKHDFRDACGITTGVSLVELEYRERLAQRGRSVERDWAGLSALRTGERRWTQAGRDLLRGNLIAFNESERGAEQREEALRRAHSPESRAKRSATLRARVMPEDERAARAARLLSPEMEQARAAGRATRLKGHGTVACYKRGCRCEPCREAKRRSR